MCNVTALLLRKLAVKSVLPEICRDRLYLLLAVFIAQWRQRPLISRVCETPEGRHLSSRSKCLRVFQPNWNPLFAQFQADVLQVRSNLLLILHQVLRLQVQLIDAGGQYAVSNFQRLRLRQNLLRVFIAGAFGRVLVEPDLFLIAGDLIFQLADVLPGRAQRICLAIESFVPMTAHAATLIKEIAPEVQRVSSLRNTIFRMTLLTARFCVFLFKHRPEPELVAAVSFNFARRRAAVAPVTTRAAEFFSGMNLQDFFVGMTDESARQVVGFLPWPSRRQIFGSQIERFANAGVTNFAAVYNVEFVNTDLMRQDRIVKLIHLAQQSINLRRTKTSHVVLQIVVALLGEFRRFL